jgi:2-methylcitrate dehydratase
MNSHSTDLLEDRLVTFAQYQQFSEIEPQILHAIKLRFIDTIGCTLAGYNERPAAIARSLAAQVRSSVEAGVIGTAGKSSPEMAAFANTTMIRCLDLNDDYFGKDGPHPSDLIGAVLAAADAAHADGALFITSIVVAYEILCTLVDAVGIRERGWDYVTYSSLAAALGAGKVLNLSPSALRDCLSLAATASAALGQTRLGELSMWKGMASAHACRNGVFACLLAQAGVSGPYLSFSGKSGFVQQISGPLDLSRLGASPLRAGIVYLKSWPVFYSAQAAVDAAVKLREKVQPAEIKSLVVESYQRLLGRGATDAEKWAPQSRETADHSVPFCVAIALLDGDITSHTFDSERFLDQDAIDLMAKVSLREDPEFTKEYPARWNCRIIAETVAGVRHEVHVAYPKGHPENPFSDTEVEEKFIRLAKPSLGMARCRVFLDWAWRLEEADQIEEIFPLLALP